MARRRGLSPEDRALWTRVTDTVAPMHPARRKATDPLADTPTALPPDKLPPDKALPWKKSALARQPDQIPAADPGFGGFSFGAAGKPTTRVDLAPSPSERLRAGALRMDHKKHRQMTQGKLAPDSRIDLHGMTLSEAQPALMNFVIGAHARGHRLVLVITGKGRAGGPDAPLPVRPGALRHNVPHWLHMPPLGRIILQVTPAHRRHGGDGAYYVYLRKPGTA
ncbi:Smr/MutS family protein [Paracoccus sp. DMF-8]|uniref:Smr/MutS family protein n=1 Tax=Paracoccus sp. DMF-8 TaxID=3019445 RepID=UPI0023E7F543|nr:Smr/MutS family protein [Paracoccus sp. DMF-8]MDF3605199.1 Smr/MutS family protein [Paracoccus sp. DMF-8]